MKNNSKFGSKLIMVALIGLSTVTNSYAERVFISINENKLEGELIKFSKNIVSIEAKSSGKVVNIPINMLSMDDIEYVKNNFDPTTGKIKFNAKTNAKYIANKIPPIIPLEPFTKENVLNGLSAGVFEYDREIKSEFNSIAQVNGRYSPNTDLKKWDIFKFNINERINGWAGTSLSHCEQPRKEGNKWAYPKTSVDWHRIYTTVSKREYLKKEITQFIKFVDNHFVFDDKVKY